MIILLGIVALDASPLVAVEPPSVLCWSECAVVSSSVASGHAHLLTCSDAFICCFNVQLPNLVKQLLRDNVSLLFASFYITSDIHLLVAPGPHLPCMRLLDPQTESQTMWVVQMVVDRWGSVVTHIGH